DSALRTAGPPFPCGLSNEIRTRHLGQSPCHPSAGTAPPHCGHLWVRGMIASKNSNPVIVYRRTGSGLQIFSSDEADEMAHLIGDLARAAHGVSNSLTNQFTIPFAQPMKGDSYVGPGHL